MSLKKPLDKGSVISLSRKKRLREKTKTRPRMAQFLPNMVTVLALCTGLSAIRFALMAQWELAVIAILISGILDAMDGRLARFLGSVTDFGAELDSLSDFISFGVAPAIILYLFILHQWKGVGWGIALFFSTCMALRLARFNVHRLAPLPSSSGTGVGFFMGVPAPAGAFLALLPLMLSFILEKFILPTAIFAFFVIITALLMVSRLPTFSLRKIHLPQRMMPTALLGVALLASALFSAPWETLCLMGVLYLSSIPFSVALRQRQRKKEKSMMLPPPEKEIAPPH